MRVKALERKIANLEGFEITIRHLDGKDVNSLKEGMPTYPYSNAARNDFTVGQWREQRFQANYPGFKVGVFLSDGVEAPGNTKLGTVRDTYRDE
jgi:hypothetical protein